MFFITVPLAVIAIPLAWILIPAHVNETKASVDNLGGILSLVLIGTLILAINFAPVPGRMTISLVFGGIALVALALFYVRQRRAANPLYDLKVAARPTFWPGACAGIVIFGSLMGAIYIGQQYLQNVLGYSTLATGASIAPAAVCMVLVAPRSAKIIESHGTRFCVQLGQGIMLLGFLAMLLLWKENIAYWKVALPYVLIGTGVGLAGPPTSNTLTRSVPVTRAGMASGTADLHAISAARSCSRSWGRSSSPATRRPPGPRSPPRGRTSPRACRARSRSRSRAPPTSPSSTPST